MIHDFKPGDIIEHPASGTLDCGPFRAICVVKAKRHQGEYSLSVVVASSSEITWAKEGYFGEPDEHWRKIGEVEA